jgi:hypothetical protein
MKTRWKSRGVSMALYAMFIAFVGVPLIAATVDITRVWLKRAELTNALEAACSAYANTPDTDAFINQGRTVLGAKARGEGYRLFGYNIPEAGSLTGMSYVTDEEGGPFPPVITAQCSGTASIRPIVFIGLLSFDLEKTVAVKAKFGTVTNFPGK